LLAVPTLPLVACASTAGTRVADPSRAAAEVDAAERAFAKTMADRDLDAFTGWVAEDAVFVNGRAPLIGREAIRRFWARFFESTEAPFAWKPEQVLALDDGSLAWSEGPVMNPEGAVILRYQSVWRRIAGGPWRVVFDQGHPVCAPAQAASES
jgi:ketosteroid isomerase-like protein